MLQTACHTSESTKVGIGSSRPSSSDGQSILWAQLSLSALSRLRRGCCHSLLDALRDLEGLGSLRSCLLRDRVRLEGDLDLWRLSVSSTVACSFRRSTSCLRELNFEDSSLRTETTSLLSAVIVSSSKRLYTRVVQAKKKADESMHATGFIPLVATPQGGAYGM